MCLLEECSPEERNNRWNTPYLFNAKELDEETGLYYYGARYYDPRVSVFYGVDPLVEKTGAPYQYCYQNPILFVDKNGMWPSLSDLKEKAAAAVETTLSFVSGVVVAITDNASLGLIDVRRMGTYSDAKAYNIGQDIGDIASMVIGVAEVIKGLGEFGGEVVATIGSGGTVSLVSIPVTVEGVVEIVHGSLWKHLILKVFKTRL